MKRSHPGTDFEISVFVKCEFEQNALASHYKKVERYTHTERFREQLKQNSGSTDVGYANEAKLGKNLFGGSMSVNVQHTWHNLYHFVEEDKNTDQTINTEFTKFQENFLQVYRKVTTSITVNEETAMCSQHWYQGVRSINQPYTNAELKAMAQEYLRDNYPGFHISPAGAFKKVNLREEGTLECKMVQGRYQFCDGGSGAKYDLQCYEHIEDGWFMLGHGCHVNGGRMVVVKEGPMVRKATSWKCIWNDAGSGNDRDYDIWIPQCGNSNFIPLGVVCVFGTRGHSFPRDDIPVALVHKNMCEPSFYGEFAWSDAKSKSNHDVTLNMVPQMGVMWPSVATMLDRMPQCHRIKSVWL